MTKKHFIALADKIIDRKRHNAVFFTETQLTMLADFCLEQNSKFNRERWFSYIAGECGKNGGSVKASKKVEVVR